MTEILLVVMIKAASVQYEVPLWICYGVVEQESAWNTTCESYNPNSDSWDRGLWQLNSKAHPQVDPFNTKQATQYAVKYLRQLYNRTGSWYKALVAYNGGIGRVHRPPKQSVAYAMRVLSHNPMYL
jgi:soluble lytic murein transglycosylase-like protein